MNEKKICPCCGAKMIEYRFGFNKGLAVFLGKLFDAGGLAKTDDLGLTYSQRTNSQKLRYWGLAEPVINEESAIKRGWWQITNKGVAFLLGRTSIPKYAITYRGEVVRKEGDQITFKGVSDGYEYHADYANQASAQLVDHDENTLFSFMEEY